MTILKEGVINAATATAKDLVIKDILGDCFSIQVDGSVSVNITGSHKEYDGSDRYNVPVVDMTTLSKQMSITGPGLYLIVTTGIDDLEFELSGTDGRISWKELGD